MARGRRKRRSGGHGGSGGHQAHGTAPNTSDPEAILAELEARAGEIEGSDGQAAGPLWGAAHKLLLKTEADPGELARLVATRDPGGLRRLIRVLRGIEAPPPEPADDAAEGPDIPPETLKKALRAFRRRLKLTRLDHESRLGVGPMSSGRKADFDAIIPPQEFPPEVWQALVAASKLRPAGPGFYMLTDPDPAR